MTEKIQRDEDGISDEGTIAYLRLTEEIVGIFDALPTEGEFPYRDAAVGDLKNLTLVELADQLQDAEQFLNGLFNAAEAMGVVAQLVHRDSLERVEEAHRRAKAAAGIP